MSLPSFTNPSALWLLAIFFPIFIWIGFPRMPYRRRRDTSALIIRLLIVTLIVMSLAGLEIRQEADKLAVVFLIDHSDSMDANARSDALDYVQSALDEMDPNNDQAAVILFGSNALVEEPINVSLDISQFGSDENVIRLNTDLAEAIQLGLALFPADTAKRMVILSDGIETVGDAERAARLAEATGVQIEYVPYARQRSPEILVSNVSIPTNVSQGEPFDLVVTIESETDTTATLRVFSGGRQDSLDNSGRILIYEQDEVDIESGISRYVIGPIEWDSVGFLDFQVQIEPQSIDGFYRNNELWAFTRISGQPRVLMIAPDELEVEYLRPALEDSGLVIDFMTPDEVPLGLAPLTAYSSIILVNTPATELPRDLMELFQIYVKDLGGGLVVVGGPDSYGVGGYFETPLEETLPVEMRIRDQERVPQLTIVFVIDRSGSMEMRGTSGVSNLELAKEAVIRSFNFLNDYDRAGVLSFDTQAFWVVDIQEIGNPQNRSDLQAFIASLKPGGGTDIFGGLSAADRTLPDDPSELKHIILLTDGGANPSGILPLVNRMYTNHDITTSVVAVGANHETWLAQVPQQGGGNFHVTTNVENIPTIFAAETVLATRSYIFEDPFVPALNARSPIMDGITSAPSLYGYVATTEKDTATVVLTSPEEDPILASWQYGLGRAVAFTSDATARWGVDWVGWDNYQRFWNQTVRWTITEGKTDNLEAWVEERGEEAVLVVDARDNRGDYLNALDLDAAVVFPNRTSQAVNLNQVAPGRYEAPFTPTTEGAYFIRVAGATRPDAAIDETVAQTTGWVLSYSAEYRPRDPDTRFLERISNITNGRSVADDPASVFAHDLVYEEAATPIWPWLLGLAAVLLIGDIAIRRIVINRSDVDKIRQRVAETFGGNSDYDETQVSTVMSGLKQAKQRAGQPLDDERMVTEDLKKIKKSSTPASSQSQRRRGGSKPTPTAPAAEDGTLASRLLKKKRDDD